MTFPVYKKLSKTLQCDIDSENTYLGRRSQEKCEFLSWDESTPNYIGRLFQVKIRRETLPHPYTSYETELKCQSTVSYPGDPFE